jgi:hypothetical protein
MKGDYTRIPVSTLEAVHSDSLDREFLRLQTALIKLESELFQTGELLRMINEYMHEKHIVFFPVI